MMRDTTASDEGGQATITVTSSSFVQSIRQTLRVPAVATTAMVLAISTAAAAGPMLSIPVERPITDRGQPGSRAGASRDSAAALFPNLVARLDWLASLANGWNGPRSLGPSTQAQATARRIVNEFAGAARSQPIESPPQIAPLTEGGFLFEWRHKQRELLVSCDLEGTLEILESAPDHEKEYRATVEELRDALNWLLSA